MIFVKGKNTGHDNILGEVRKMHLPDQVLPLGFPLWGDPMTQSQGGLFRELEV